MCARVWPYWCVVMEGAVEAGGAAPGAQALSRRIQHLASRVQQAVCRSNRVHKAARSRDDNDPLLKLRPAISVGHVL